MPGEIDLCASLGIKSTPMSEEAYQAFLERYREEVPPQLRELARKRAESERESRSCWVN